jgi:serine/threonine protein kinase
MRFLEGQTLGEKIDAFHGPAGADFGFPNHEFRRLLGSFVAVCEAVAYAHSRNVIHRDIKPGNIMVGPYGETFLLDWGLAKLMVPGQYADPDETVDHVPGTPALAHPDSSSMLARGTPAYMSPEQVCGDASRVGPASDIFSLGATLYVLLTGKRAYTGRTTEEVAAKARQGRFPAPRSLQPGVPAALEAICLRAMAIEPGERYLDVLELARDVERWLADEPVSVFRERYATRAQRWLHRHRSLGSTIAASALLGVFTLAGGFLYQKHRTNTSLAADVAEIQGKNAELEEANRTLKASRDAIAKRMEPLSTGNSRLSVAESVGEVRSISPARTP